MTAEKNEGKTAFPIDEIQDNLRRSLSELGITDPLYEGIQGTFGGGRMRRRERQRSMLDETLIAAAREGISPIVVVPRRLLSDYLVSYAGYDNSMNSGGGKDKRAA